MANGNKCTFRAIFSPFFGDCKKSVKNLQTVISVPFDFKAFYGLYGHPAEKKVFLPRIMPWIFSLTIPLSRIGIPFYPISPYK